MVRIITNRCNVRLHSDGEITPLVAFLLPFFSRKLLILLYLFNSRGSVDLALTCHPDNQNRTQKTYVIADCQLLIADWHASLEASWPQASRWLKTAQAAIAIGNDLTRRFELAYNRR
jgi:hypothetical protein